MFMPVAAKDPEGTHCEQVRAGTYSCRTPKARTNRPPQISAGYNFTVALFYPGLRGSAKSRNAVKNVFGRWRDRVRRLYNVLQTSYSHTTTTTLSPLLRALRCRQGRGLEKPATMASLQVARLLTTYCVKRPGTLASQELSGAISRSLI